MLLTHFLSKRHVTALAKHIFTKMPSDYKEAVLALNKLQSNVEYIKQAKIQNNQQNNMLEMRKFLNRSGITLEQLDTLQIIHVAGTNGKGSTCSYSEAILRSHGFKTGFFSSPHLLEVRERIRINGKTISKEAFAEHFWRIFNMLDKAKLTPYDMPLYFRFLTLLALHIFLAEKVDVAILEVGIGGEYDCTNIVRNTVVAAITPLDMDHTALLGNTIESIAWNKAGIIKPGAQVFTTPQSETAIKIIKERGLERKCSSVTVVKDIYSNDKNTRIPPHIQHTNASLALSISEAFINSRVKNGNNNVVSKEFDLKLAKKAIESTRWPGRYEIISRKNSVFYLDGAHTLDSMKVCSEWFLSKSNLNRAKVLVFNVTGERNPENLLKLLLACQFSTAIFTPNIGDSSDNADVTDEIQTTNKQFQRCQVNQDIWQKLDGSSEALVVPSFAKALTYLESQTDKQFDVLVTGSIHLIGAAMSVLDPTLGGIL